MNVTMKKCSLMRNICDTFITCYIIFIMLYNKYELWFYFPNMSHLYSNIEITIKYWYKRETK